MNGCVRCGSRSHSEERCRLLGGEPPPSRALPSAGIIDPPSRALARNPSSKRKCVGSSSNDGTLPPEVEALCALLAHANQRIAAERRSTSRKLRVVR